MKAIFRDLLRDVDWISAIFVSVATLGTAWCALQASIWSGKQTFHLANSNGASRSAIFTQNEANQERLLDAVTFSELASAYIDGDQKVVEYFLGHLPEGSRDSLDDWFGTPGRHRKADLYSHDDSLVAWKEAESQRLHQRSNEEHKWAEDANHVSDTYVMVTALFASSLFCSGIGSKAKSLALQNYFMISAAFLVVLAMVYIFITPITFRG